VISGMGKMIVTLIVLGLLWLGYVAWPLYDLYVPVRAFEMRDVETVTKHVYFDSLLLARDVGVDRSDQPRLPIRRDDARQGQFASDRPAAVFRTFLTI
jgi:hypothetical protein